MNATSSPASLAFDLGASSGRAILGTLVDGKLEMEAIHRFKTPITEDGGSIYWDLDQLWSELREGLELALNQTTRLSSLSVDSWGVDYVPLDAKGRIVRPAFCYRDQRTNGLMEAAFERVPASQIYARTGIQFMQINTLYQIIADVLQGPDLVERTANRLPIADYFNNQFGGSPVSEISLASTSQIVDVHGRFWDLELLRRLGLPVTGWPTIVDSGSIIGDVEGAAETKVVATCSHDTGCAVAATPSRGDRWAYISCGTWSLLGIERNTPLVTEEARKAGFTNEAGIDGTIRFLKNLTGLWALQECIREWNLEGPGVYETVIDEAESTESTGCHIDLEDDRFLARGGMEARIHSYCQDHGQPVPETRGATTRLILESIADSYRQSLEALEEVTNEPVEVVHIVGGGAQNAMLCRLTAQACHKTVIAGPSEATAIGNLLIQMRTMGDLPEGQAIRDVVRASFPLQTYHP